MKPEKKLTDEEYAELQSYFSSYSNYESGKNLKDPIDPFTYLHFFDSSTALHELGTWGKGGEKELRAAELLIKGGADIDAEDVDGYSPLFLAVGVFPALAELLEKHGAIMKSGPRSDDKWRYRGKK